jgi:hypothetical protein
MCSTACQEEDKMAGGANVGLTKAIHDVMQRKYLKSAMDE